MGDRRLVFLAPARVAAESFEVGAAGPGELLIRTLVSAISAGTEGHLWKGTWPAGMALDGSWNAAPGSADYPVRYGYASVGEVEAVGAGLDPGWRGSRVFSFTGHQSRAVVPAGSAVVLPPDLPAEDGVFAAALETALTLVQDAAPVIGETVGVWGLGTIGVLASALAARSFSVLAWDTSPARRRYAQDFGVQQIARPEPSSCDVSMELTGNAAALDEALRATRFSGRVVVGSWYGSGPTPVSLGGEFHRSRIQIVSSQVSTLSPALSGRWTKKRRFETVLDAARVLRPSRLVTHRFTLDQAPEAYRQACDAREGLQVLFTYE